MGRPSWSKRTPTRRSCCWTSAGLVGIPAGGNPHQWYSPDVVHEVIDQITADYQHLDPPNTAYFDQQRQAFVTTGMAEYDALIASIKATYAGTPIGGSESIVTPLAQALGLDLITPSTFLTAISEGSEPTAADKTTVDRQIKTRQIKIFIYNSQNSTPDVQTLVNDARRRASRWRRSPRRSHPPGRRSRQWQVAQLQGIQRALAQATGR